MDADHRRHTVAPNRPSPSGGPARGRMLPQIVDDTRPWLCLIPSNGCEWPNKLPGSRVGWVMKKYLAATGVAGLIAVLALGLLIVHAVFEPSGDTGSLTLVLISSVVALVAVIAVVAAIYSWLGLTDPSQALALPDGSVRSIIALLLIVIFAMLAMFFYEGLSSATSTLHNQTQADVLAFINKNPGVPNLTVAPEPAPPPTNAATNSASTNGTALSNAATNSAAATGPTLYVISYGAASGAGSDFAKQLMAGLQALLTTVLGFYFGAKTAASSAAATAQQLSSTAPPAPNAVSPSTLPSDGGSHTLTVSGANLNSIVAAHVERFGSAAVPFTAVASSPTQVTGTLVLAAGMTGAWDVVLVDGAGKTWKVASALTLT
jgi:hypothetical protein